jgi:hypothetical protein
MERDFGLSEEGYKKNDVFSVKKIWASALGLSFTRWR